MEESQNIRDALARFRVSSEDERAALGLALRVFERNQSAHVKRLPDDALELYGMVALELGLLKQAKDAFERLARQFHKSLQGARLRTAVALRKMKRPEEAQCLLEKIEGTTRDRVLFRNEIRRTSAALRVRASVTHAAEARQALTGC